MSQFTWPPVNASNPSVGGTGTPAPLSATEVAGVDSGGDLIPILVASDGTVFVDGSGTVQPVSGTVTVVQPTGTNLHAVVDSGSVAVTNFPATQSVAGTVVVTQPTGTNLHTVVDSGTITVSGTSAVSGTVAVNNFPANQVVSGTVSAAQSGAWTATVTQATGTNLHAVIDSGTVTVSGTSPVSGTVTANQGGTWTVQPGNTPNTAPWLIVQKTPAAGAITQAALTVGTTAVRATVSGSAPSATRSLLVITPDSASTAKFYIGTSTVTSSGATRGAQIVGGQAVLFNYDAGDYYIISDTAAQTVYVMEQA